MMREWGLGTGEGRELLEAGLKQLELFGAIASGNSQDAILSLLQKYIEEIELFNKAYGLVKVHDRREFIIKHIFDSLTPIKTITRLLEDQGASEQAQKTATESETGLPEKPVLWQIADVGSGAGLPGIPLALLFPNAEFTLIERMGRRAGFLVNCIAVLGISNIQVEEKEMEKAALGRFDTAVFRAFRPLEPAILKGLLRLLKPGGFLAAWKGQLEKAQNEMMAVENVAPGLSWEIQRLKVPFLEEERCLVIIRP